jgi:cytochrome c oxidase subunit IV
MKNEFTRVDRIDRISNQRLKVAFILFILSVHVNYFPCQGAYRWKK